LLPVTSKKPTPQPTPSAALPISIATSQGIRRIREPQEATTSGKRKSEYPVARDDAVDQRIDDRIGNAGEILGATHRGGLRGSESITRMIGLDDWIA
jgi:hypothetical protein